MIVHIHLEILYIYIEYYLKHTFILNFYVSPRYRRHTCALLHTLLVERLNLADAIFSTSSSCVIQRLRRSADLEYVNKL